ACTSDQYALGYEDGCAWGQADAYSCSAFDEDTEVRGSDYARGVSDGYAECYEVWVESEGC
ncbi:MAG: hypothetical protein ACYTFV_08945, partial [Planctomycetota bacterium]